MACPMAMWPSWMRGVASEGTRRQWSHRSGIWPPPRPVMPTVTRPFARATCRASRTLGERPEVEMPNEHVAGAADRFDLAREQALVAVVVADRGEHRGVGGQREGGQARAVVGEPADQLAGQMLRVGGAAAVAGEQDLVAAAQRVDAGRCRVRDGREQIRRPRHRAQIVGRVAELPLRPPGSVDLPSLGPVSW